jgi:hypothetical protein
MYLTITLVYGICLRNIPSWEGQGWVSSDLAIHPSGSRYRVYTPNPFSQGGRRGAGFKVPLPPQYLRQNEGGLLQ